MALSRRLFPPLLLVLALVLGGCSRAAQGAAGGESGRAIQNKGSDTMVNLALAWAEAYRQVAPEVAIAVTGGGRARASPPSSTARSISPTPRGR